MKFSIDRSAPSWCRMVAVAALVAAVPAAASAQTHSVARQWNDELLSAIRVDFARPTVHARNLFHVSLAMWDAWAAYDAQASTYLHHETAAAGDVEAARAEAISYAAYRILTHRFLFSPGSGESIPSFNARMQALGYDPAFRGTEGGSPAALGNRIAATVLEFGANDNSNEAGGYFNRYYLPANPPLLPALPGNPSIIDVNRWQPLVLDSFIDQGGNVAGGAPEFLSAEWGQVTPFALNQGDLAIYNRDGFDYWVYLDPGPPPLMGTDSEAAYKWHHEMVGVWSSHLDPEDGVMWDISPGAIGNAPLPPPDDLSYYNYLDGGDWGTGHPVNPITGMPYEPQIVPRGDYTRVLAEFWADGPDSETPPGHWFSIANYVSDHEATVKKIGGQGEVLNDLEWDVKLYFVLGGAVHDAAVAAWGAKGWYDYVRPISALRYMSDQGQASDPSAPRFNTRGMTLRQGLCEVVTSTTTAPGGHHEHLRGAEGKIALYAWRGPAHIANPDTDVAGVGWILAENWWPYQRPTFVTPPFAGYVSGHSTFSRAAALALTHFTGSYYFPGGLGEFLAPQNEFLVFEEGPSMDVTLQWATYVDASDQTSLSRIWGGIHPPADDIPGRYMGHVIGERAFGYALTYFNGQAPAAGQP